jgi:hypothetical protein
MKPKFEIGEIVYIVGVMQDLDALRLQIQKEKILANPFPGVYRVTGSANNFLCHHSNIVNSIDDAEKRYQLIDKKLEEAKEKHAKAFVKNIIEMIEDGGEDVEMHLECVKIKKQNE